MPLFLSDEEYELCLHDGALVAEKADSFIRELYNQLETVKAQADAASITAEQTCSLLEQKYVSLSSEFTNLQSQYSQLNSSLDQRLSELAQLQAEKHQIHLQSIGKDGEIERLSMEASEFHKSKRQLLELLEQKDIEISEKNVTIKSYLDKIVNLTDNAAMREARLSDAEAELARSIGSCARLSQEKELIERHNVWLNDELTAKVNSFNELRRTHNDMEADMTAKLADVEKKYSESSSSLKRMHDRVKELELQLTSLQEELCSSKDTAAATEEQFQAEISTVTKLVELYKESSEEWSKKAGELEGVIKALETHTTQVESDYKERFDNEVSARKELEKEAACLKEKLDKCEAELESARNSNEMNLLTLSSPTKAWVNSVETSGMVEDNHMLVPSIPLGVSGTALAASLLRDGWSLAKMYAKYQETVDALRHEELGRKQSEAILQRVLYEIEEKAGVILDERAEHERLVDAYSAVNKKLQHSLSEQTTLQKSIQELKADLRRHERDYDVAQKEIVDLQKQVTVLLKECRDIQLRCGSASHDYDGDVMTSPFNQFTAESDVQKIISERLLTFKDINGLVEQNAQLRSLVRKLSDQIENKEVELKENFEKELQKRSDEAASKVDAVLARAEEQGRMIESLHTSVAMYKRLYEEEHKLHSSAPLSPEAVPENGRKGVMLLLEGPQEAAKKAHEQVSARVRCLEEELAKSRSEIVTLRLERDKLALEANFVHEKLNGSMKEFEHQRGETNSLIARNVEFSQLIIDYQRKVRESSESLQVAEELSRKLSMEVSVLKHEKEMLINSERRACDEVRSLSERVHRLQATLETIQSAEEVREEARGIERRKQEEYTRQIEREWAEAKKDLQEERHNARTLRLEREGSMTNAMRQVEEMGKELANALHAVAAAEARAAVAEARCSDLEKKINSSEKVSSNDGEFETSTDEVVANLRTAKEEINKLREEVQVNKDHMLQYKGIAQVNESALKQMEVAHENFKVEAAKVKISLESEVSSLRERVNELEAECSFKSKEAASVAARQEEALSSSLSEIVRLKEESSLKMSQIAILETQLSAVKENLEEQQQKWRTAQTNYERQVILQSETIQELTKTSQALASLQEEASHLRNVTNSLEAENNELKAKWETEKSLLENSKNEAEKKYSEINEQNKILHSRLEALHIKLAERDRGLAGKASGNIGQDSADDAGLQNVVNYLRRSKEIAETEISLLKQEKLRLQAQLESAIKTAETTQASLRAERANSRALLYTDEEFKSLQLQVREMNLLRESNIQLREENRLNFEECQKLREAAQKARNENENLETLLASSQTEVEALKKEIEMQLMKREHLEKRVDELLERCKNISVEDYDRMREDVQQMQVNSKEKDSQLEEIKKSLFEKQEVISHLEQDLATSRTELDERETRINYVLKVEASLKSDVDKQRRFIAQLKKKSENLSKEKEELSKENQALSKQLEDSKQQGKRSIVDAAGEQASREKEKEKDTRIQILEKTLERQREELRKQKDDNKIEKAQRLKTQKTITDLCGPISQERTKLEDELKKHKQALKSLSDEVEKLKHVNSSQPEGTSAIQVFPGTLLDDMAAAYLLAVDNFERVAHPIVSEVEHPTPADPSLPADATFSGATSGQTVPLLAPSIPSQAPPASILSAKTAEESERRVSLTKTYVEPRKTGRKLVRPRILKPEESQPDVEMSEMEESNNEGKTLSSQNIETQGNLSLLTQPSTRKRQSTSELQEESLVPQESNSDLATHVAKKTRGSDSLKEGAESQSSALVEIHEIQPAIEESADDVGSLPQDFKEDAGGSAKDETEIAAEQADGKNEVELQNEMASGEENLDRPSEIVVADDQPIPEAEQEEPLAESGSDREEGELATDTADLEGAGTISNISGSPETGEIKSEDVGAPVSSPGIIEETVVPVTDDIEEVSSPQVLEDDKNEEGEIMEETAEPSDKLTSGTDQAAVDIEQAPATLDTVEQTSTSSSVDVGVTNQGTVVATHTEVSQMSPVGTSSSTGEQVSPAGNSSTTINLNARARERAMLRQAGVISSSAPRGRGRATLRGRAGRVFRGGCGSTSGQQG